MSFLFMPEGTEDMPGAKRKVTRVENNLLYDKIIF